MAIYCKQCKKIIKDRQYFKCSVCNVHLHLDCTSISFQRYRLMSAPDRSAYKCDSCRSKHQNIQKALPLTPTNSSSPTSSPHKQTPAGTKKISTLPLPLAQEDSNEDIENVTHRQKYRVNVEIENSFDELPNEEYTSSVSTPIGNTNRSYSEIPHYTSDKLQELREKIETLEKKLEIAENEIDNMSLENHNLNKKIAEYELKVKKLSHICKATPESNKKKQNQNRLSSTRLDFSTKKIKPQKVKTCKELTAINNTCIASSTLETQNKTDLPHLSGDVQDSKKVNTSSEVINLSETNINKQKICLISTNSSTYTRNIAQRHLRGNYDMCHYLMTNHGIKSLLHRIDKKVENFTFQDYCIIMMGDLDFDSTTDYHELIYYIRNKILQIVHTNVIICLPTYRYSRLANLFNWRVELFNHLLYLDNMTHEYANIIDSNLNLTYDFTSFRRQSGSLNNRGMQKIFNDINEFMESDKEVQTFETLLESPQIEIENLSGGEQPKPVQADLFRSETWNTLPKHT